MSIDVGCFNDIDFQFAESGQDVIEFIRIRYSLGECLVQVIKSEVPLLFGQFDQLAKTKLNFRCRISFGFRFEQCVRRRSSRADQSRNSLGFEGFDGRSPFQAQPRSRTVGS